MDFDIVAFNKKIITLFFNKKTRIHTCVFCRPYLRYTNLVFDRPSKVRTRGVSGTHGEQCLESKTIRLQNTMTLVKKLLVCKRKRPYRSRFQFLRKLVGDVEGPDGDGNEILTGSGFKS